ncbi:MAG: HAMP domain-containing sensor histidine kinase [Tissierellia bacterium]|nr:HAMP domain-containing sensor histidine kinase [Tissierellia bacterium]
MKLKRQIIRYFVLFSGLILILESAVENIFLDYIFPARATTELRAVLILLAYGLAVAGVFALFSFLFYRSTARAVEGESARRVEEQNRRYAYICHDLKTPMTSVQGFARALKDGKVPQGEEGEILEIILEKSRYAGELLESMYTYATLDEGGRFQRERGDLCALVREVTIAHYHEFEDRGIALELDIPQEAIFASLDQQQMRRALANLVINGYKYNEAGSTVLIEVAGEGDRARVSVADNGRQIPPEEAESIFQPFTRGDRARSGSQGNGLGLAIAKLIAENHGGKLHLDGAPPVGTKAFVLELPRMS